MRIAALDVGSNSFAPHHRRRERAGDSEFRDRAKEMVRLGDATCGPVRHPTDVFQRGWQRCGPCGGSPTGTT